MKQTSMPYPQLPEAHWCAAIRRAIATRHNRFCRRHRRRAFGLSWEFGMCSFACSWVCSSRGVFGGGFQTDGRCWADEGSVGNTGLMLSRRLRRIPLPCKRTYLRTLTRCMPSRSARRLCTVAPSPATHSSRRSTKSKQCSLPSRLAPQIAGTNTPTAPRTR